jgi:chemotaxis protein CheD
MLSRLVVKIKSAARIGESIAYKLPVTQTSATFAAPPSSIAKVSNETLEVPRRKSGFPSIASSTASTQTPNYDERIGQCIIGVGEFASSNEYGKIIKTFALGSCVAINLFSPTFDVVGMAHIALATSTTSPEKAKVLPGYFADTALPALINAMRGVGYRKPVSHLVAKIAGGAQTSADANNYFKIGEKNILAVKSLLQTLGITLLTEDVGDSFSRTVFIQVGSKAVHLSSPERTSWVI